MAYTRAAKRRHKFSREYTEHAQIGLLILNNNNTKSTRDVTYFAKSHNY